MEWSEEWEAPKDEREDEYIYHLATELPASNEVRQLALRRVCSLPLPEDSVDRLLDKIAHPSVLRIKEQVAAVSLLGHLDLDDADKQRCLPCFQRILNIGTAKGSRWLWFLDFLMLGALPLHRLRAATIRTCGRLQMGEIVHLVGSELSEAQEGYQVRRAAAEALPTLLASLTTEHYSRVHPSTVPNLCRALSHPDDTLVMRILEALEQLGDERAVPYVQDIVEMGRTPEMQFAARRILPILQERKRQDNAPHLLLRSSMAPSESPEILLRAAAYGVVETEPNTLLRASSESNLTEVERI